MDVIRGNKPDTIKLPHLIPLFKVTSVARFLMMPSLSFFMTLHQCIFHLLRQFALYQIDPILIDLVGIRKLIGNLKTSSSTGSDEINSKIGKCTELHSSFILYTIFQQSLHCSSLPSDWQVRNVVLAHKSGNTHAPEKYHPISLTSILCKILEHMIYCHLINFLQTNSSFNSSEHGFRKSFSCETQLACFTKDLFPNTEIGFDTDCIFIDFAKPFSTVSHHLLIRELRLN